MENAIIQHDNSISMEVGNGSSIYTSMKGTTKKEKAMLYKAMTNPDKRLADCINSTILAKDLFIEKINMTNESTGEVVETPRIVIIDKDGTSYQCVSFGVFNALKRVIAVFGEPTWSEPLPLKVLQVSKNEKKMLTLDIVL